MPNRLVIVAGVATIVVLLAALGTALYVKLKVDLHHASAPFIQDGVVYYGDENGRVYAVDVKRRQEIWRFQTQERFFSTPSGVQGVVYFGSGEGVLYAVGMDTGEELWRFATGDRIWTSPAIKDGVLFFGSFDGRFYAVEAGTGVERWRFTAGDRIFSWPSPVFASEALTAL